MSLKFPLVLFQTQRFNYEEIFSYYADTFLYNGVEEFLVDGSSILMQFLVDGSSILMQFLVDGSILLIQFLRTKFSKLVITNNTIVLQYICSSFYNCGTALFKNYATVLLEIKDQSLKNEYFHQIFLKLFRN